MNTHYLTPLFTPGSIALFGASDRENSVGGIVFKNLMTSGFKGRIYGINPKHTKIGKRKAYQSLSQVRGEVDLAVIVTPAATIPAIIDECGEGARCVRNLRHEDEQRLGGGCAHRRIRILRLGREFAHGGGTEGSEQLARQLPLRR